MSKYEAGLIYLGNGTFKAYNSVMGEEIDKTLSKDSVYQVSFIQQSDKKTITWLQMKSLHLWFDMVSTWLTDSGFTVQFVLSKLRESTLIWTKESVKEIIFRNIIRQMFHVESTKQLSTKDVTEAHEAMVYFFNERMGVNPPAWPDEYTRSIKE